MITSTCAIYARCATDIEWQNSIDNQIRICKQYAGSKGWQVRDEHIYRDIAISGTSILRPDLNKLLYAASVEPAPFQHVIVADTDRLARSLQVLHTIISLLQFTGIHVHFVREQIDYTAGNSTSRQGKEMKGEKKKK